MRDPRRLDPARYRSVPADSDASDIGQLETASVQPEAGAIFLEADAVKAFGALEAWIARRLARARKKWGKCPPPARTFVLVYSKRESGRLSRLPIKGAGSVIGNLRPGAIKRRPILEEERELSMGNPISFGTNNDQNIIVEVNYDIAGRMTSLRDPRGKLTQYQYDNLDRRTKLTDAGTNDWDTSYSDLVGGGAQTVLDDPLGNTTIRVFDPMGRLESVAYGAPGVTPDVRFAYDAAGNRSQMTEYSGAGFTSPIRETTYSYDDARRLTSVGFDNDGGGAVDETVSYEYDAGGRRTKMTLPGSQDITYTYDATAA